MANFSTRLNKLVILFVIILISSCNPYLHQPLKPRQARLGPETNQNKELTSLPAPKEKIVTAVYKFRDQTGQYKASETGANWSTAISQGTTAILLRALEESKWFVPIERENISNLLNERKIIRSSRAQYSGQSEENSPLLPPLLFAGVILEGGIISYEANVITGGMGIRYFDTGVSGQYREDVVTVYLRAVSTSNGNILKTVYTTKSILSQKVDVGVFRYVKFKKLLEAETGFTYNEPTEMAITEAIEKAVTALILEGQKDGLWEFENPADSASVTVRNYFNEKEQNEEIGFLGHLRTQTYRGPFSISAFSGINKFDGDYKGAVIKPLYGGSFSHYLKPSIAATVEFSHLYLNSGRFFKSEVNQFNVGLKYIPAPFARMSPYMRIGAGIMQESKKIEIAIDKYSGFGYYGLGIEYLIDPMFSISVEADHNIAFTDGIDGLESGKYLDMIWTAKIGLSFYFGNHKIKSVPIEDK